MGCAGKCSIMRGVGPGLHDASETSAEFKHRQPDCLELKPAGSSVGVCGEY